MAATKKRKDSRAKGRRGEIKVKEVLESWTGLPFQRSPGSGAWSTINNRGDMVGDLVCPDNNFAYCPEVKNVEKWSLEGLLNSEKGPIWEWWRQTLRQAEASAKIPLLLLTKNRSPIYGITLIEGMPSKFPGRTFCLQFPDDEHFLYIFLLSDLVKTSPAPWIKL